MTHFLSDTLRIFRTQLPYVTATLVLISLIELSLILLALLSTLIKHLLQ